MNNNTQTSNTLKRAFSHSSSTSTSTSSSTTTTTTKPSTRKNTRFSRAKRFLRSRSTSPSSSLDIPRSTPSHPHSTMTPAAMSPRSSLDSMDHPHTKQSAPARDDYRRYSGTVNHYGRHSNDWLFGGFSLRDTVRGGVDRLRHHHHNHHSAKG
ncbi:hypothetical protein BO70DRAFT_121344 [Aspergillus heteromorphus CBS 117.55]|uniref:Uncharacterized protein n=1 Tax=Aspergillus heteromorphus CBS 117.55 TaxID=1448321 RepID=A0A317VFH9_9EURO|nr:uncharacterized protein BO70DRAFT_121344 [Aspergillus heteromorphus CBS 117.55]PWY71708.1 hypothetical protein BO70DRAFT_121344 [Aspergillus heteromorphus CBS 117.55]